MSSYQTIETPQDYVNYTFNISARGITEVSGEIAGLSNTVTTILGQLAFKTSEYLTHTESLMIGIGTASAAAFASATQNAIKFEQAIANVQAIGGESIDAMEIGKAAMQYSNQFGMNVDNMTEGLEALSRAGLTATNVMSGVLNEGVKLSKLEGIDLEDSINNLIATTNLLSTEDLDINSQEYANAVKAMNQHIVSTSESAPINAENIIQTLQHVGGYASANNIDQDDLFAVIAQLGAKGTKGEMAGTALRAFIAAGQKDQAQRALSRIGLNVSDLWDASGEAMLPISEMKNVIDNALDAKGYSKQEKLEFYSDFAGYKQANQVMKIDTSEVKEYKETIAQAWDLGKKLDTILGTTHNNLQILFQTMKNFASKVGASMLPIINATIIPIKWGVQLLDKIPFSENITGLLLTMVSIKSVLLLINRVVPTLASMYTSFTGTEQRAKNISGHMHNIVNDLKSAKEVLSNLDNPIKLSQIRVQQGLMGEQSYKIHREVTKEIYTDLQQQTPDLPDWNDLENYSKEALSDLMEAYKKTELYQNKQQIKTNKLKNINEVLGDFLLNNKNSNKKETPTNNFSSKLSNLERNNQQHQDTQKDFINTTKEIVQEINNMMEKTNDERAMESASNEDQHNITKSILNAKDALAEAIGREVSKHLNAKETLVSDTLGAFQIYGPKSSKAAEQLRQIESSVSNYLGDIGYFLDYDLEKIDDLLATVRYDLQRKITAYTNNNPNFINDEQGRRMEKIINGAAKTNLGRLYSTEQNNIDIHNLLTTGQWNNPGDQSSLGIHNKQMEAMEIALNIDVRNDLERTDRLNNIYKELNRKYEGKAKDEKIAEILKITQELWKNDISHNNPSGVASQYLTNTRAAYIGNTLGLGGINWHQIENPAEELIKYFADTQKNSKKDIQLKQADRLMFSIMESTKASDKIFNESEADELGYIIRRYRQLLLARNNINEKENKKLQHQRNDEIKQKHQEQKNVLNKAKASGLYQNSLYTADPFTATPFDNFTTVNVTGPFLVSISDNIASVRNDIETIISLIADYEETSYEPFITSTIDNVENVLEEVSEKITTFLDDSISGYGSARDDNVIRLNPFNILNDNDLGTFRRGLLETYSHEVGHIALNHFTRNDYMGDFSNVSAHSYHGTEVVSELEAELLAARVLSNMGMNVTEETAKRIDKYASVLADNDLLGNIRYDLINTLGDKFSIPELDDDGNAMNRYAFLYPLMLTLKGDAENEYWDNSSRKQFEQTYMDIAQLVTHPFDDYTLFKYENKFYGEGNDEEIMYQQLREKEERVLEWERSQRFTTSSNNDKINCCLENQKFLITITQHLSDYTKFFVKAETYLKEIIDLLNEVFQKEQPPVNVYNYYNTLNVFQTNMEQSIKSLPQSIKDSIEDSLLLPSSTIEEEDIINTKALVIEDVEEAILMIKTAHVTPQSISPQQESNISLRALYQQEYGPEDINYDTPPLLGFLLALPEKIQEVTTDFVLIGEAIDLSKIALEEYLQKETNLSLLPPGSRKGYHNAYPENPAVFPSLSDTLTQTRNIYTQKVVNEPYNVTEQQLRSVGLHGLVPMWQQNLTKLTSYNNPIGPQPANIDWEEYQQYLAIEEERHRLNRERDAKAEAELQEREAEKIAGMTERYNAKMAAQKERLDKQAAEEAEQIRRNNADKADRKQALEDKIENALKSPELADHIISLYEQNKKDKWDNIAYNQYKKQQVTTQGMNGYYSYLNDIAYQQTQKELKERERLNNYNKMQNDLLIKEARRLAPLYQLLFTNYTELNQIVEEEIKSEQNRKGPADDLITIRQYPESIGPKPFKSVGDHNAAQASLQRLKERREQQIYDNAYTPSMGTYYTQINDFLPHGTNPKPLKKGTALEQATFIYQQNEFLKEQQKEFLNIANNVSEQAKIEEEKRKQLEQSKKAIEEETKAYNELLKSIKIRYAHGETLTNTEIINLPKQALESEFERNPQRAMAIMFDTFDIQQAKSQANTPLSLVEREAYMATAMMYDSFERFNQKFDESVYIITRILDNIYKLQAHQPHNILSAGPNSDDFIETSLATEKDLKIDTNNRVSTIMRGGVFYGGTEKDLNDFAEDWDENTDPMYRQKIFWEQQARKIRNKFNDAGESIDNFLDKKLSKFSDDPAKLEKVSKEMRIFTQNLEGVKDAIAKASKIFPPFLAIAAVMEGLIGALSFVTTGLATAETVLTAARMLNTEITEEEAITEGAEAAWNMAQKIKIYTKGHKNIQKIIEKSAKYITKTFDAVLTGIDTAIGFIIENIAVIGPIATAIAIAVGALWLSEQNHANALKKATEEQEKARKETYASYLTYQNLHNARKNETDAMKRQQLARKESIALYKLEADRIRQLDAIKTKTELQNNTLWGEYGVRADLQKSDWTTTFLKTGIIGLISKFLSGDFESQYENYDDSTGEIRRIKEESLGNIFAIGNQNAVSAWYDAHIQQLGQIEAFAPQLQELYDLESRLIDKYGSKQAARDSEEFKKAVQEFADATGLNKETAEKYLDYLQTEANVENARYAMQAEVNIITSKAQAEAYKALYGDKTGMGELDNVQDSMVYATADQIFKDAYQELWWSMLMEWLSAIYYTLTLNWSEADKHRKAAGAYQEGMKELAENQQRITEEGVEIAREDQRQEYEKQEYSFYGDTPFGGAVSSSAAMEQDWAIEEMHRENQYYNASESNGQAAVQGFKDGLDQHSPGKIARSAQAEMMFAQDMIYSSGSFIADAVSNVSNVASTAWGQSIDGVEWIGGNIFNALSTNGKKIFDGVNKAFNKQSNIKVDNSKTEVHIHTININTEDDPEKIKTELMNLIVELGDLIAPRQVSRIIGEPPSASSSSTDASTENESTEEDTSTDGNSSTNDNNNNNNPTV